MDYLFRKYASRRSLIILLVSTLLCNALLTLYFIDFSAPILDTVGYYSADKAYKIIGQYGEAMQQQYIRGTMLLDFIYPIVYCLMLSVAMFRVQKSTKMAAYPLWILPVDYVENILLIFLVSNYPERFDVVAGLAGMLTLTKWTMVFVAVGGILLLWFRRSHRLGRGKGTLSQVE